MTRNGAIGLVVALVAMALVPLGLKNYGIYLLTLWCVYSIVAMGLNQTVGYAGLVSLGQAAFFGIGAYTAALLMKLGWPFLAVVHAAAIGCFFVGLIVGFPALRVQHHFLAFAIGAAFGGVAGVYFVSLVEFIEPRPFHVSASLMMLLMVIVGGSGRFFGPVLGAGIVMLLPERLRFMQSWYLVIFGFAVVAPMVWVPGGLLAMPARFKARGAAR